MPKVREVPGSRSPNDIDRRVGRNLRQLRLEAGLSLQELAARIGLSHQQLQKYETGSNRLSVGLLPGFAEALGVDVAVFFEDADAPPSGRRQKTEQLRSQCESWLRRTESEDTLRSMLRVLKALAS
ncbi:MAG: hypothetical protein CVT79_06510 [Alphaproteobacteria bacterium HGW-Alphaproteobacteria-18]|nr:MAG: hypothetical protein CVT79_06510 [Alphaproteobacteria bacterium HGW-Alphaproteobacteria-18]